MGASSSSSHETVPGLQLKEVSKRKVLEAADSLISVLVDGNVEDQQKATDTAPILPHALIALERFFRLDGFDLAFAHIDKSQLVLFEKCWIRAGRATDDKDSRDKRIASLLPFVALEKLLRNAPLEQAQEIRNKAIDLGIIDVLLTCLSHIARHEPRLAQLRPSPSQANTALLRYFDLAHRGLDMAKACYALKSHASDRNEQYRGWNRGVGYGSGSTTSKWNIEDSKQEKAPIEEAVTCFIRVIAAFLNPVQLTKTDTPGKNPIEFTPEFVGILHRSCFQRTLHYYLLNDSVFEIAKHVPLFEAVFELEAAFASIDNAVAHPSVLDESNKKYARRLAEIDLIALLLRERDCGTETIRQLEKLERVLTGFEDLKHLLEKVQCCIKITRKRLEEYFEEDDLGFDDIAEQHDPEEAVKIKEENIPMDMLLVQVTPQYYCDAMRSVQFGTVPFFKEDGNTLLFPYHYYSSLPNVSTTADVDRMKRLRQEIATLKTSLPLSDHSCVFVTAAEERMDFLITGPTDTPYENGCFEFDVLFPSDYPSKPMKVNLATTGNGSVRFNPNLYNCGKVCLSLLGTWDGRPEESWQGVNSSLLQVLVSIQSLILVPDPYFNEPGYQSQRNSLEGKRHSREYNADIRVHTVRWAMTEMLRNPPPAFANVIRRHFWLKSDEICEQVEAWISDMEEKAPDASNSHVENLKRAYEELKKAFREMKPPEGFEKVQPIRFPKPKPKDTNTKNAANVTSA